MLWRGKSLWRLLWIIAAIAVAAPAAARGDAPPTRSRADEIRIAELPAEARETLRLIKRGGPYPHDRDGVAFGNYEKLLPEAQRGHYREYTVSIPGLSHRGTRRIVVGCERQRPGAQSPGLLHLAYCRDGGEFYYTADHYRTFRRVVE